MICVNCEDFPQGDNPAVINPESCDGCGFCVEVCPKGCLKIIDNPKRPGHRVVRVLADLCIGCGVCQGTCPKESISIPGLSTRELRGFVREALAL